MCPWTPWLCYSAWHHTLLNDVVETNQVFEESPFPWIDAPTLPHIVVLLWYVDTEMAAPSVQTVPWPVQFPVALVMILSAGSAAQSCVILSYCLLSIVALFVYLSDVGQRPEAELFMPGCPGGENCITVTERPNACFCSSEQVEFLEAGTGSSCGGRLGYKWKHFF